MFTLTSYTYLCSCLENVGGRKCDTCLPGHHSFPYCQMCNCDPVGTEEGICNQVTSQCLCKVSSAPDCVQLQECFIPSLLNIVASKAPS